MPGAQQKNLKRGNSLAQNRLKLYYAQIGLPRQRLCSQKIVVWRTYDHITMHKIKLIVLHHNILSFDFYCYLLYLYNNFTLAYWILYKKSCFGGILNFKISYRWSTLWCLQKRWTNFPTFGRIMPIPSNMM